MHARGSAIRYEKRRPAWPYHHRPAAAAQRHDLRDDRPAHRAVRHRRRGRSTSRAVIVTRRRRLLLGRDRPSGAARRDGTRRRWRRLLARHRPGSSRCGVANSDVGGELAIRIFDCTKPVIAAVNGTAVGIGITMILPMDIRIAADTALFTLPFTRRGIVPESCATWFLPRVVGISRAVDWAVTVRSSRRPRHSRRGLVRELLPAADVLPRARGSPPEIAERTAPISVGLTRQMMWKLLGAPHPIEANRLESKSLLAVQRMPDTARRSRLVPREAAAQLHAPPEPRPARLLSVVGPGPVRRVTLYRLTAPSGARELSRRRCCAGSRWRRRRSSRPGSR